MRGTQLEFTFSDPDAPSDGGVLPPGEYVRRELDRRGLNQTDLARMTQRTLATINEIINAKRTVTPEMAVDLGTAFGTSPALWLHREAAYRISLAPQADSDAIRRAALCQLAPVSDMENRGWIPVTRATGELENALRGFYGVSDFNDIESSISAAARQSCPSEEFSPSQRAWLHQAKRMASILNVRPFSKEVYESGLAELRTFAASADKVRHVPRVLAEMGVRFVIVQQMPKSRIDGAMFWMDDGSPTIVMSLRYDRIDCFWFTLAHELAHVTNGDKRSVDSDIAGNQRAEPISEMERKADSQGSDWLVPSKELSSFIARVSPCYSREAVALFAKRLKAHPGIIVGQLHHRQEIGFQVLRDTLVKIRDLVTASALTDGFGKTMQHHF